MDLEIVGQGDDRFRFRAQHDRVVVEYPIGIVICGVPAVAPLGTEPMIAMKSSLGSAGVSLFIIESIASHCAARRIGIAAR